jgi:hypothetical protein
MTTFLEKSQRRFWLALVGSFAIYFLPLVGPHGVWFYGDGLLRELRDGSRETAWIAADIALAVMLQAAAGLLLFWAAGRTLWLGAVALLAALPMFTITLNLLFLVAIPLSFLVEADTAAERQDWPEHCTVAGVSLLNIRTPVTQPANGVGSWWVSRPDGRYALLRVPSCDLLEAAIQLPPVGPAMGVEFMLSLNFATADGTTLLRRMETASGRESWLVLRKPDASLIPVPVPHGASGEPILSNDGGAVAWLEAVEGSDTPTLETLRIRSFAPDGVVTARTDLESAFTPIRQEANALLELDTAAGRVTVWQDDRPRVLDLAGVEPPQLLPPSGVQAMYITYRRSGTGWLAWDAYQEQNPYVVAWSIAAGTGTHRVPKGRSITSAAVDPTGRYVAISTTTARSIGNVTDAVFVLRASDGAQVFRRNLPAYSRSTVVFFGREFFAYSEGGRTHVLRIPG